jgi:tRNA1Val (adenine37-N6)-methyltransferase
MADVTRDALFAGAVVLTQPARSSGYRVNVDALLLAAFAAGRLAGSSRAPSRRPVRHAVDLGSGVGAVGLALLHYGAAARLTMVELDPMLARLAAKNVADNGWAACADVVEANVGALERERVPAADLVVCNPPYVAPGRGRPPAPRVRQAKLGDLGAFVDAARRLAGRRARACFVYPAVECVTLLGMLRTRGLEPKRLRAVHGRPNDSARVVLVEGVPGKPGGLTIEPPFVETDARGTRTPGAEALVTDSGTSR